MSKRVMHAAMALLLAVFLFAGGCVAVTLYQYRAEEGFYEDMAARFTSHAAGEADGNPGVEAGGEPAGKGSSQREDGQTMEAMPPITVDFQGLQAVNGDVCGWIYCEGTAINYPVVAGEDNDYYLRHDYAGNAAACGAIFAEAANRRDFADANTILYGHHMKDGSMFAGLDEWASQAYYEEHPVMWLLTPGHDYQVILFAGYTTSADSEAYAIFQEPGEEMDAYLRECQVRSDFQAAAGPEPGARCVMLSTCAYVFDGARYVLHGELVPVGNPGVEAGAITGLRGRQPRTCAPPGRHRRESSQGRR